MWGSNPRSRGCDADTLSITPPMELFLTPGFMSSQHTAPWNNNFSQTPPSEVTNSYLARVEPRRFISCAATDIEYKIRIRGSSALPLDQCAPFIVADNFVIIHIYPCLISFRWKSENVSTTEVSNQLTDIDFVIDACVYGVTVPGKRLRGLFEKFLLFCNFKASL